MANEVSASVSLQLRLGALNTVKQSTGNADAASPLASAGVMTVGTSEEAIPMGDVVAPGFAYFKNVGTNVVKIRPATGDGDLVSLKAGEAALFPMVATAPYAIALVGNGQLEYHITSR